MAVEGDSYSRELETKIHETIKKVTLDYESLKFNTAVAAMMTLVNEFYGAGKITKGEFKIFLILLNPVAPHITEEIWQNLGLEGKLFQTKWAVWEEAKTVKDIIEIAVQINGKVKAAIDISAGEEKEAVREKVMNNDNIKIALSGKIVIKEIYVTGRIYNIVVK